MTSAVVLILREEKSPNLRRLVDGVDDHPKGVVHGRKTQAEHHRDVQIRRPSEDAQGNSQTNVAGNRTVRGAHLCKDANMWETNGSSSD